MKIIRFFALSVLLSMPSLVNAQDSEIAAVSWHVGDGQSCQQVCRGIGMQPVSSGVFTPGGKPSKNFFYVCSADYRGEGYRGGFNLKPAWSNVCVVPFDGKEVKVRDYLCACER